MALLLKTRVRQRQWRLFIHGQYVQFRVRANISWWRHLYPNHFRYGLEAATPRVFINTETKIIRQPL